ncbi:hypothetical protein SCOR_12195 [Sulfidibacter corallicola]
MLHLPWPENPLLVGIRISPVVSGTRDPRVMAIWAESVPAPFSTGPGDGGLDMSRGRLRTHFLIQVERTPRGLENGSLPKVAKSLSPRRLNSAFCLSITHLWATFYQITHRIPAPGCLVARKYSFLAMSSCRVRSRGEPVAPFFEEGRPLGVDSVSFAKEAILRCRSPARHRPIWSLPRMHAPRGDPCGRRNLPRPCGRRPRRVAPRRSLRPRWRDSARRPE